MAKEKKLVEAITSMNEDFAQWYTDVVKKAELCDYTSVKGFMAIKPYGYAIWENIQHLTDVLRQLVYRTWQCQCLFQRVFLTRKRIM